MFYVDGINPRTRQAGVVWQPCATCGRDWPFPVGYCDPAMREWLCHVCVQARLADMLRTLGAVFS